MKKILALIISMIMIASIGAATVSASGLGIDVGEATENTVEEAAKDGCVGGATALPFYGIVIAGAVFVFKKRA